MKLKAFLLLGMLLSLVDISPAQQPKIKISTEEDIKADMELGPCKGSKERREAVKKLFLKMGAAESEIVFEKLDEVENVVVLKKGKTEETVVVGAHFDKAGAGCGIIDNWTGIVILTNLYRTMRDLTTQKTYKFVAFDKEELGLLGSAAMAEAIPKERRAGYCAMVNFDSFGLSYPQALGNISSESLINLAKEVSEEMKLPFSKAGIELSASDSESFRIRNIPAIGLHGLNNQWKDYLHTQNDSLSRVNPQSVYLGYRHGLVLLSKVENKPCDEFRKGKKQ
jgi:hypothetical protein